MKKIFSVLEEVREFLIKHPVLRDSDERLMANIWAKHLGDPSYVNGDDILKMLANKELPSYESISRCRRKIQQSTQHLDKSLNLNNGCTCKRITKNQP